MGFAIPILASIAGGVASAGANKFFQGTPEKFEQRSRLGPEQQPLYGNLQAANAGPGAGGSFGSAADYYRDILSNDSDTANQMFAPEMRRYNQQIIPDLAAQFAGAGAGGLSSSSFRNAAVGAGTDLSERLGAIRARLRSEGAAGLMNLGQQGLGDFNNNIQRPGTPGFLESAAPGIGQAIGQAGSNWLSNSMKGSTSPYGGGGGGGNLTPPQTYQPNNTQLNLPQFGQR